MSEVVYRDDNYVIRKSEDKNGFHVYVHPVINGNEMQPRGYMLGSNSLWYKPLPPKQ